MALLRPLTTVNGLMFSEDVKMTWNFKYKLFNLKMCMNYDLGNNYKSNLMSLITFSQFMIVSMFHFTFNPSKRSWLRGQFEELSLSIDDLYI